MGKDRDTPPPGDVNVEELFNQFGDLFQDLFAAAGGNRNNQVSGDIAVVLTLTPERSTSGGRETVSVEAGDCQSCTGTSCKHCQGRGSQRVQQGFFMIERACTECSRGVVRPTGCSECRGTGLRRSEVEIVVPAGVESGQILRLTGQGTERPEGGAGDLYIHIVVENVELPRALVRQPRERVWPMALAVGGVIAAAAAASLLF